jgi:hypothetical protein
MRFFRNLADSCYIGVGKYFLKRIEERGVNVQEAYLEGNSGLFEPINILIVSDSKDAGVAGKVAGEIESETIVADALFMRVRYRFSNETPGNDNIRRIRL